MENFEIMSADDFFSKYGELAGQRLMFGRPAAVKHCSANVFGDCVAGTLLIPDKKDTEKVRLRCGFRLDGDRLLIIDDDGQAEKIMREVQDGGSIDGAGAAFIMFSLIEYVIRDDLLFLDGYDKKLDAVEDMVTDGSRGIPDDFDGYLSQHRKNLRDLGYPSVQDQRPAEQGDADTDHRDDHIHAAHTDNGMVWHELPQYA